MNRSAKPLGTIIVAATMMVSGCGGGGSEVAADLPPIEQPSSNTLTLSGLVTDDPVVNANVSFMVGADEFVSATPTGSAGEFQLQVKSDNPNDLVVGRAHDVANSVYLTAVLDSFQGCIDRSVNRVVADIKVTNITTAQQVLAERLALDGNVESYDEYMELSQQIDATELLELSASIKTVVENINGTVLPTGYADTLDLARAIADGSSTFDADVELVSPGTLAFAQDKLLTDGNATETFAGSNAPGVYAAVSNEFVYAVFADGSALVEQFDDSAVPGTPSWSITDRGNLQVNYINFRRSSDRLTRMGSVAGVMHLVADFVGLSGDAAGRRAATVEKFGFGPVFAADSVAGSVADPYFTGDDLVFSADGTGISQNRTDPADQSGFVWSIDNSGHLRVDFTGSPRSAEFVSLSGGDGSQVLAITRYDGQYPTLAVTSWN